MGGTLTSPAAGTSPRLSRQPQVTSLRSSGSMRGTELRTTAGRSTATWPPGGMQPGGIGPCRPSQQASSHTWACTETPGLLEGRSRLASGPAGHPSRHHPIRGPVQKHLASWRDAAGWHQALQAIPAGIIPYVGLYRNTWSSWSDGSQHGFKNFLPGRPSGLTGDCAASFIGGADAGKWTEDFCDQKLPFVCNYEEKHQLRIKLRVLKSSVDLNDPAVTEAIVKLLEEKMKEKGIPAGFKLRFIKKPDDIVFQEEKDEL